MARPTKYMKKTPSLVRAFTARMTKKNVFEFSNYALAVELGIHYETLCAWRREDGKEEFSDAIKELEAKRAALVIPRCMDDSFMAPGKACFALKNWTDMRDRLDILADVNAVHGVMMYGKEGKSQLSPEEFEAEMERKHGPGSGEG